ncbi:hypothetical protein [Sporomusa acidovorans]|nr:hypothetical protein [Sporomusa acidovorans]
MNFFENVKKVLLEKYRQWHPVPSRLYVILAAISQERESWILKQPFDV